MLTINQYDQLVKTAAKSSDEKSASALVTVAMRLLNQRLLSKIQSYSPFVTGKGPTDFKYSEQLIHDNLSQLVSCLFEPILTAIGSVGRKLTPAEFEGIVYLVVEPYLDKLEKTGYIKRLFTPTDPEAYAGYGEKTKPYINLVNMNRMRKDDLRKVIDRSFKAEESAKMYEVFKIGVNPETNELDRDKVIPDLLDFLVNNKDTVNLERLFNMGNSKTIKIAPKNKNAKSVNSGTYDNDFYKAPIFEFLRKAGSKTGTFADMKGKGFFPVIYETVQNLYKSVMGEAQAKDFFDILDSASPDTQRFLETVKYQGARPLFYKALKEANVTLAAATKDRAAGKGSISDTLTMSDIERENEDGSTYSMEVEDPEAQSKVETVADSEAVKQVRLWAIRDILIPGLQEVVTKALDPKIISSLIYNNVNTGTFPMPAKDYFAGKVVPHIIHMTQEVLRVLNTDLEGTLDTSTGIVDTFKEKIFTGMQALDMGMLNSALAGTPLLNSVAADSISTYLVRYILDALNKKIHTYIGKYAPQWETELIPLFSGISGSQRNKRINLVIKEVTNELKTLVGNQA
jgi:hypothetical protein